MFVKEGESMEDYEYEEDVTSPSTADETKAYFTRVDAHLKDTNAMEGTALEGDPILIFCNGQPYEMDPSAGVKTPEMLEGEWGTSLVGGDEAKLAIDALAKEIGLTMSSPYISTIAEVLKTAVVPSTGQLTLYAEGVKEPDSAVRAMDAAKAKEYGFDVAWLKGMKLDDR